jgi:hypothetical protein
MGTGFEGHLSVSFESHFLNRMVESPPAILVHVVCLVCSVCLGCLVERN